MSGEGAKRQRKKLGVGDENDKEGREKRTNKDVRDHKHSHTQHLAD